MLARERYNQLVTDRRQFLDKAVDCSELTFTFILIQDDTTSKPTHETFTYSVAVSRFQVCGRF